MRTDDLDYDLPQGLIATQAAEPRDSARLLVYDRAADRVTHARVRDLPELGVLRADDVLVTNNSRVLPARFSATRQQTGGRVTGLYLEPIAPPVAPADAPPGTHDFACLLESGGKPQPGEAIALTDDFSFELIERGFRGGRGEWLCRAPADPGIESVLAQVGSTPLPPYIRHARKQLGLPEDQPGDAERYNTVYADQRQAGSVAAPTAGLHFTPALLDTLQKKGVRPLSVTLHVGMGTFAPVRSDTLEDHPMHTERFYISPAVWDDTQATRSAGGRVIAVGTTTVRALESATGPGSHDTALLIQPGPGGEPYDFKHTDALLTNFHLPRSTLLALVAALPGVGINKLLELYQEAIDHEYRFYSFGDAMLIV